MAVIKSKKWLTKTKLEVTIDLEGDCLYFESGQYFVISLINPKHADGKGNTRIFSFINSPNEKNVVRLATNIRDTAFKKNLSELKIGSQVCIDSFGGDFTLPDKNKLVFIAGGIGITPFMSMLQYIKEEKLKKDVILLYSNRTKDETAYFDELKKMLGNKIIFTMTQDEKWNGEKGRINSEFIKKHVLDINSRTVMIAGPPQMVSAIKSELMKIEIPESKIIIEKFEGY